MSPYANVPPTIALIYSLLRTPIVYTGMIFVWVGLWDVLDLYCNGSDLESDICYMFVGLVLLIVTHSFFPQSGMKQLFYQVPPGQQPGPLAFILEYFVDYLYPQHMSWPVHAVHAVTALTASILFWLGTYNLFDIHLFVVDDTYSSLRHVLYMVAGLILLWLSGTLESESEVTEAADDDHNKPLQPSSGAGASDALPPSPSVYAVVDGVQIRTEHRVLPVVLHYARALVALYGSVIYWVGAYNMIDVEIWDSTSDRDIAYVIVAASLYVIQSCLAEFDAYRAEQRAKLNAPKSQRPPIVTALRNSVKTLWYTFRVVLGLVCSIMYWVGWWNVLTYYIVPLPADDEYDEDTGQYVVPVDDPSPIPYYALYLIYIAIGLVILTATGALLDNSGLLGPTSMVRRNFAKHRKPSLAALYGRRSDAAEIMLSRDIDLDRMAAVTPVDAFKDRAVEIP